MAFVPETGEGLPNSNSYATVQNADDYNADRGNASWAELDVNEKQAALVRATDYIEQTYGGKWKGERLKDTQALEWPRKGYNGLPRQLIQATCQLALESSEGTDLSPVLDRAIKREKVGPLEAEYMDNAAPYVQRPAIDGLLMNTGWLTSSAAYGSLHNGRAVRV